MFGSWWILWVWDQNFKDTYWHALYRPCQNSKCNWLINWKIWTWMQSNIWGSVGIQSQFNGDTHHGWWKAHLAMKFDMWGLIRYKTIM